MNDIKEITRLFLREMELGLAGQASSLPMIPSFLGNRFYAPAGERVVAVDAGGTNLRISRILFGGDGLPVMEETRKYRMPGSDGEIGCDTFFDMLAGYLSDLLDGVRRIGFCFSYEVEIQPDLDGKILSMSKEVVVTGCQGKMIGRELKKALLKKGVPAVPAVTVLNDTTACLLGGRLLCNSREYGDYLGFVLGTGTNICYYEDNGRITKLPCQTLGKGRSIINVESACFAGMPVGELDESFFMTTKEPAEHRLEKLVSGQYLGSLFLHYAKNAAAAGAFQAETKEAVQRLDELSTAEMNAFMEEGDPGNRLGMACAGRRGDREKLMDIADSLTERAAVLSVASMAACLERGKAFRKPGLPVLVTAEGTTFNRCRLLRDKILSLADTYIGGDAGICVHFASPEDSVICGTALAAVHTET